MNPKRKDVSIMTFVNCKECGKAFVTKNRKPICPDCEARLNEEYERVRDFIKDNPQVTLDKVVDETGIPPERVRTVF